MSKSKGKPIIEKFRAMSDSKLTKLVNETGQGYAIDVLKERYPNWDGNSSLDFLKTKKKKEQTPANGVFRKALKDLKKKGHAFFQIDVTKPEHCQAVQLIAKHIEEKKRLRFLRFDTTEARYLPDRPSSGISILSGLHLVIKVPKDN